MAEESPAPEEMTPKTPVIEHVKLGVGVLLAAIVILFTVQNVEAAQIRFLVWTINLSLSLLIFGVLAAGFCTGWLISSWLHLKRSRAARKAWKGK